MLSLLKSVLKSSLKKPNRIENDDQQSNTKDETIANIAGSDFAVLWLAAEREAKAGNDKEARHLCYLALEKEPDNPILLCQLGTIEQKMAFYDDARDNLLTAIHADSGYLPAYRQLALLYRELKEFDTSIVYLKRALEIAPNNQDILCDLGNAHASKKLYPEAVNFYEQALAIAPDWGEAYSNLSNSLLLMNEYEKAVEPLLIAKAMGVTSREIHINFSYLYSSTGYLPRAYRYAQKALQKYPEDEQFHWMSSWSLLLYKHFHRGWMEYEYRFCEAAGVTRRNLNFPEWQGENLTGKTILIIAEQGLGDQLMFASCFYDIVNIAQKCIIECDRRLLGLFENSFPNIQFIGTQLKSNDKLLAQITCDIDYYTHIGSLPRWLRNDISDFYPQRCYLKANVERIAHWRQQLQQIGSGLKIGISWRGGVDKTRTQFRTIRLADWEPILKIKGVHFINLQYGDCKQELQEISSSLEVEIHHWPEAIADYQETAALVSSLDLVLSVCTSVIHLAGGLGKKTWVLVPAAPEWRYLAHDKMMPWYLQVQLFRQQRLLEWQPLLLEIADKLRLLQLNN